MDYYNQNYGQPQYEFNEEYGLNPEFEQENDASEFNYESEPGYELLPEFEMYEAEPSYESDYESDYENNMMQESGMQDEMEAELEYVSNENEFNNWVNEIVVRDHRNRNQAAMQSAMRRPIVRTAVRQLSRIAARTLPWLGRRVGGWRGPVTRPYYPGRQYSSTLWNRPGYRYRFGYPRPFPFATGGGYNPGYSQASSYSQSSSYPQSQEPAPAQEPAQAPEQDGSFRRFVMDTIKNLSDQIAAGNENIAALRSSMVNSAVSNFPQAVQPKADGAPPPEAPQAQAAPPPTGQQSEFEYEDYEYERSYDNEFESGYDQEYDGEVSDSEGSFREETEMELASNLLGVRTDNELDHFLGDLFKKAVGAVSGLLTSDQGNMLKGIFKSVAKKVLPMAGTALGGFFGGPAGAAIGGKLAGSASNLFELELEGLSNEDREFETARALVRFAGNAARQVADQGSGDPREDVRTGIREAAVRYAPGLLMHRRHRRYGQDSMNGYDSGLSGNQGTWYRKGNRIILENI